ncbi:metallophosphoesterase family protein [Thalassomonas haliotis]|uniref:Metallophosphoesterase n=1 Tax=Thalassomonas haliotis TaxID=485448 RepID=A0ABY7VBY1_9GAMM|nr:metallophosphoesterase [Thalassomonas haliotis]WDE10841.1 metallophosphoesterase [Thalassomonas haliotis]
MDFVNCFRRYCRALVLLSLSGLFVLPACAANGTSAEAEPLAAIPKIFQHAVEYQDRQLVLRDKAKGTTYPLREEKPAYLLAQFTRAIKGNKQGLVFDFNSGHHTVNGTLYFGLIDTKNSRYPLPVYFKKTAKIADGKAEVNLKQLSGKYDATGWRQSGQGELGYRVVNSRGQMIFDGQVSFLYQGGVFRESLSFIRTPSIHNITATSAVLAFETNFNSSATIRLNGKIVARKGPARRFEIPLNNLLPQSKYLYRVEVFAADEKNGQVYENIRRASFSTAPLAGSRKSFTFAYASDSRRGQGGGERDFYGVNAYMLKKLAALALSENAAFLQFSGDLIDGRRNSIGEQKLEYRNWQQAIAPFSAELPVYATMGNHEGLFYTFEDGTSTGINIDRFPFASVSAEAVFADSFVLPENGPLSEDGADYDPNPDAYGDFPPYKETVYSYRYDNVAMVVLNSNYLFSRSFKYWFASQGKTGSLLGGGGLHGYIMDQQMAWLEQTLGAYQDDDSIDFIFVSQHTPVFPNGGHKSDGMWYYGSNSPRPYLGGVGLARGIIEQRNKLLGLMNRHSKVFALLTGDEHNYARTLITPDSNIHPPGLAPEEKLLTRPIWQINNGAAGAPYYAQEKLPWSSDVVTFSMQHALVLFHVSGKQIRLEVLDPDTLSRVD